MFTRLNITAFFFLFLAIIFAQSAGNQIADENSMKQNLSAEFVGIALTVLIIDQLHKELDQKKARKQLARSMRQDIREFLCPEQPFHSKEVYLSLIKEFEKVKFDHATTEKFEVLVNKLFWRIEEVEEILHNRKDKMNCMVSALSDTKGDAVFASSCLENLNNYLDGLLK